MVPFNLELMNIAKIKPTRTIVGVEITTKNKVLNMACQNPLS